MKTVFIRAIEAAVDEKAAVLREAVQAGAQSRFDADVSTFSQVPRSPFCYWVSELTVGIFQKHPSLSLSGVNTAIGASTKNDFRYLRLATEVPAVNIGASRPATVDSKYWIRFAKGGQFSVIYADIFLAEWHIRNRKSNFNFPCVDLSKSISRPHPTVIERRRYLH